MACLVLLAIAPYYRGLHADDELFFECGYLACFDAIALGCLSALFVARFKIDGLIARALRWVAAAGIAVFYLRGIRGNEVWGFSLVALCTALYVVGSARDAGRSFATGRATAFMRWFGRHSYELYLFHIIVLASMRNVWDKHTLPAAAWLPWLMLFVTISALAAMLVARFVSEPANRALRKRLNA
jgi:peptidoglycan/LPS O-acetylase OafA/YrhL